MPWRYDGGVKCPECDNRATVVTEKSMADGSTRIRHILKCASCGHRTVLQEVLVTRSEDGLRVKVIGSTGIPAKWTRSGASKSKPVF